MPDVLEPPKIDANGLPILPGYRKPFTSETARIASAKGKEARAHNRQARLLAADKPGLKPSDFVEIVAKVSAINRAHTRCLAAAVASTKGSEAAHWMRAAKDALEQLQSLIGQSPKPKRSPSSPQAEPIAPSAPDQAAPMPSPVPPTENATV